MSFDSNELMQRRYHQSRLSALSSINAQSDDGEYSPEIGIVAALLNAFGVKSLPSDLSSLIEAFFNSTFARVFSFGLSTASGADLKYLGDLRSLSIFGTMDPQNLGLGKYVTLARTRSRGAVPIML